MLELYNSMVGEDERERRRRLVELGRGQLYLQHIHKYKITHANVKKNWTIEEVPVQGFI